MEPRLSLRMGSHVGKAAMPPTADTPLSADSYGAQRGQTAGARMTAARAALAHGQRRVAGVCGRTFRGSSVFYPSLLSQGLNLERPLPSQRTWSSAWVPWSPGTADCRGSPRRGETPPSSSLRPCLGPETTFQLMVELPETTYKGRIHDL